jgi:hypothetical protein
VSLSAAVLDALADAGVSREQIIAAVKADIAERDAETAARLEAKRDSNRERQRRKRTKDNALSRDVTPVTRDSRDAPPKEVSKPPVPICSNEQKAPSDLPDWLPAEPWREFVEMRKTMGKRAPFTQAARRNILAKLDKLRGEGHDPAELLAEAVTRGWRGVFAPEGKPAQRGTGPPGNYLDFAIGQKAAAQ